MRPENAKVKVEFLGRGSQPPSHQLGGLEKRCNLPQRVPGRSTGHQTVFLYLKCTGCDHLLHFRGFLHCQWVGVDPLTPFSGYLNVLISAVCEFCCLFAGRRSELESERKNSSRLNSMTSQCQTTVDNYAKQLSVRMCRPLANVIQLSVL